MRARTSVTVNGDRLEQLRCEPPLTLRRVGSDDDRLGLCLVGTAAGPLPGDDLGLDIRMGTDTRVRLMATGASIAQGRAGQADPADPAGHTARVRMTATLADGADLVADPGPLVVARHSRVDVTVGIDLAATAGVRWTELVVLGRAVDAEPGHVTLRWDITREGRPVLRQLTDLADPALRRWPGMTGGHRVLATTLLSGPDVAARTTVVSPTAVAQRIDERTVLVTVLADNAATAKIELTRVVGTVSIAAPLAAR